MYSGGIPMRLQQLPFFPATKPSKSCASYAGASTPMRQRATVKSTDGAGGEKSVGSCRTLSEPETQSAGYIS